MPDLSDVTDELAQLAEAAVYPNGTANASVAGVDTRIVQGWPVAGDLDAQIAAGKAMISVYPLPGMDRNTTRFLGEEPTETVTPAADLTLTVANNTVTVGGTINAGEAAFIGVNYTPYSYGIQATDTLDTVAAALAALIPNASAVGAVITIGGSVFDIVANVSALATLQQEIARQRRVFQLTVWAPTHVIRNSLSAAIDVYLKALSGRRITFAADDTYGVIVYHGTVETDKLDARKVYRRELMFDIEYVTSQQSSGNTITNGQTTLTPENGSADFIITD